MEGLHCCNVQRQVIESGGCCLVFNCGIESAWTVLKLPADHNMFFRSAVELKGPALLEPQFQEVLERLSRGPGLELQWGRVDVELGVEAF